MFKDKKKLAQLAAVGVIVILLIAAIALWPAPTKPKKGYTPTIGLPPEYMVFVDEPVSEWDHMFVATLSSVAVRNDTYHPMFILGPEGLTPHQAWTIEHLQNPNIPALIFSRNESSTSTIADAGLQISEDYIFEPSNDILGEFKGYDDWIHVASYEEALWVAPLANVDNKVMVIGDKPTYTCQKEVWSDLWDRGYGANYIVVTHPRDYDDSNFNQSEVMWHIPSLSVVAAEVAAYHKAFVMTRWTPNETPIGYYDGKQNSNATGILMGLRDLNATYGPAEYVCLVGSAVSVPQFVLPDPVSNEPDGVSSDIMFGFLDNETYWMDAAIGRLISLDLPSLSMVLVRTWYLDQFVDSVTVDYSPSGGGVQTINWKKHGSIWNGFEVADQRLQMSPGWFMHNDLPDEGWTYDYVRTTGNEGVREIGTGKEIQIRPIMESSHFVTYRGHGSWHATFYVYEPDSPERTKGRLEGWDIDPNSGSPSVHDFYLPPQIAILVSCENGKIWGKNWGGSDSPKEQMYSLNHFYAGGIGLIGATEVSYSNLGQDVYSFPEEILPGIFFKRFSDDDHEWDLNNAWYAFTADGLINHEDEYGTIGKAVQWAENRYIKYHNDQFSPFDMGTEAHWKEVAMYSCLGDPSAHLSPTNPGANSYDPWHNGPDDQ
jgi:hypothetical protein